MISKAMKPQNRQPGGEGKANWYSTHAFPLRLLCVSVGAWLALVSLPRASAAALPVIRTAPPFALTTQNDKPLELADLRGMVVLVNFVFTTCNGTCPATTSRLGGVAAELKRQGLLEKDQVRLVSITLDPKRDTPKALRRYRDLYDIQGDHWSFLTSTEAEVGKVMAAWGMWAKPAKNGQLDHPSRVFLLDARGRVREIYSLEFLKTAWVVEDVRELLNEAK
jgi:protein SCO1/2